MKKRAALLVALSLAVVTVLAGCGGKDSSKSADSKDSAATFEEKKRRRYIYGMIRSGFSTDGICRRRR